MISFEFETIEDSYIPLIKEIINKGELISPRNLLTKELSPVSITINDPSKNIISNKCRKLNYGFMIAELVWILSGSDGTWISHYNKNILKYSDDNKVLHGAYGDRIFNFDNNKLNQLEYCYNLLKKDKASRQATISIYDPNKDCVHSKDIPCTNILRFKIRNNKLHMITFMRSNDIIFGYPYDVYNFTMIQQLLANKLNVGLGSYTHIVDSFHLYESNFELAEKIINDTTESIYSKEMDYSRFETISDSDLKNLFKAEHLSRVLCDKAMYLNDIINIIMKINDNYIKSIAAFLVLYNYRKSRYSQNILDEISKYITNEFKIFLYRYKTLKTEER